MEQKNGEHTGTEKKQQEKKTIMEVDRIVYEIKKKEELMKKLDENIKKMMENRKQA